MDTNYYSISPVAVKNSFDLISDEYTAGGFRFAITFITANCVVVESDLLNAPMTCRSRAAAEKFCDIEAPKIAARIDAWAWTMVALVIAAMSLPTPPTTPAIVTLGKCEGMWMAHFNLPAALQDTPATVRAAGKNLCVHCANAYDKAMAAQARLNAPVLPELVYVPMQVAACAGETPKENIVKILPAPTQSTIVLIVNRSERLSYSVNLTKSGIVWGLKRFSSPVRCLKYVNSLLEHNHAAPDANSMKRLLEDVTRWNEAGK